MKIEDAFRGDTESLRRSIKALIELDDANALVPHGIGGHARSLLASAYHRLHESNPAAQEESACLDALRALDAIYDFRGGWAGNGCEHGFKPAKLCPNEDCPERRAQMLFDAALNPKETSDV